MKTVKIGNKEFEVMTNPNKVTYDQALYRIKERDLFDCYLHPSNTKKGIYNGWVKWFNEIGCEVYGISSYNTNFFTLNAVYYDIMTRKAYYLVITRAHWRAMELITD